MEVYILPPWSFGDDCEYLGGMNQTVAIDRALLYEEKTLPSKTYAPVIVF